MQPVKPIMVTDLFPQERKQLLELFSEFEAEDWEKPTICPEWTVKATARISPELLIDLLELTGEQFYDYMQTLDQMATGGVVSWAGPDPAPMWLDTAREYTERWIHQQQIRDAVNKPGLKDLTRRATRSFVSLRMTLLFSG